MEGEEGSLLVTLPSGAVLPVLTQHEAQYLRERVERYVHDNTWVNISDHQDVDRLLSLELFCWRWTMWLAVQGDYAGGEIDESVLTRDINAYTMRIYQLKKTLGLDKPARDRTKGEGSTAHMWASLLERAKYFGIMRNEQAVKAVELFMQLLGMITMYKNSDDEERREMRHTIEDIVDWIESIARPEIEEIDRRFRQDGPTAQRLWIRKEQV